MNHVVRPDQYNLCRRCKRKFEFLPAFVYPSAYIQLKNYLWAGMGWCLLWLRYLEINQPHILFLLFPTRQFHNIYTIGALEGPTSAVTTITAAVTGSLPTAATALAPAGSSSSPPTREHHPRTNQFSHMTQHNICNKFLNLTEEQRRMCMSNEKIMEVIANGARLGREECQHQFRHSRWNCTAPPNSTSLYGLVTTISKYFHRTPTD